MRWGNRPACPHCAGEHIARKDESRRIGRWNCHDCKSSFNVLSGTIMEKTRVPLQKWFLAIGLVINAKKNISSPQLGRDLDLNQKTAWYILQRIRATMVDGPSDLLQGIVEAYETYVGGKPNKRGRGTKKTPVIGAVERGGNVKAQLANDLSGKGILRFLKHNVDRAGTVLFTDEYRAYNAAKAFYPHAVINHSVSYAEGAAPTKTIDSFWALIKRAWYGTHHHYSGMMMPLYVAESCWKSNQRKAADPFANFMHGVFA